jgi:hypothetical protein
LIYVLLVHRTIDTVTYVASKNAIANLYPIKMKDHAVSQSVQILRQKKLLADDDKEDFDYGNLYDKWGIEW